MIYEAPLAREIEGLNTICERYGVAGHYEIYMKRNWTNINSFRTVTLRNRLTGVSESSYYADSPPDSSRYWLARFSRMLSEQFVRRISDV